LLAWGTRLSILITLCVIALFAFFHGSALITTENVAHNMPAFIVGCLLSALLLQGVGIGVGLLLQKTLHRDVYRYAGFAMLIAAGIISFFPGINDIVGNFVEGSRL